MNNYKCCAKPFEKQIWLDDIRRNYLMDGTLSKIIVNDGISGLTSNPAIFERAITTSTDYDDAIIALVKLGKDAISIYEALIIEDIQRAADLLRPIYDRSNATDGYVSLEISPHLAYDTEATIIDAQRLWSLVKRPNLMIKIPATKPGILAIEQLIFEGLNINATLLFDVTRYRQVIEAYWKGLEARIEDAESIAQQFSVASFFISRIDNLVDDRLLEFQKHTITELQGKAAIACAQLALKTYQTSLKDKRWRRLDQYDANKQSLLWASTSTKNSSYSSVKYVEALIVPDTITTLTPTTLATYQDRTKSTCRITENILQAEQLITTLRSLDIGLEEIADQLEHEGIIKFIEPYDRLITWLDQRRKKILGNVSHEEYLA